MVDAAVTDASADFVVVVAVVVVATLVDVVVTDAYALFAVVVVLLLPALLLSMVLRICSKSAILEKYI